MSDEKIKEWRELYNLSREEVGMNVQIMKKLARIPALGNEIIGELEARVKELSASTVKYYTLDEAEVLAHKTWNKILQIKIGELELERDAALGRMNLGPLGEGDKLEEWQACYAGLFRQLHPVMEKNKELEARVKELETGWRDGHGNIVKHEDLHDECQACADKEQDLNIMRQEFKELERKLEVARDFKLTPEIKYAIADNITIEGRSKTDVVQDVFDELQALTATGTSTKTEGL